MLQDGIYYEGGMPSAYRLLQLNFANGINSITAKNTLASLWEMLLELSRGHVKDLRKELRSEDPDTVLPSGDLQILLGYGARFFDQSLHSPVLTSQRRPRRLVYLLSNNEADPFSKLNWQNISNPRLKPSHHLTTQTDIAFQFTGTTELTVNRAIVEASKLIHDKGLPLEITNFYSGFRREDKRSWIDFHDGINNMLPPERKIAMEVTARDRNWMIGGTYMSHLQIHVNLNRWRSLSRDMQEFVVGRNKITGCPIIDSVKDTATGSLKPTFMRGCPVNHDLSGQLSDAFISPPQPGDSITQRAHIYRANFNRGSATLEANNRIYRQGYEFLEFSPKGGLLHGLNFVGFHRDIKFLTDILNQDFWMGDVNFGGVVNNTPEEPPPIKLMELLNGAYYAIPPRSNDFPGSNLFD